MRSHCGVGANEQSKQLKKKGREPCDYPANQGDSSSVDDPEGIATFSNLASDNA